MLEQKFYIVFMTWPFIFISFLPYELSYADSSMHQQQIYEKSSSRIRMSPINIITQASSNRFAYDHIFIFFST